MRTEVHAPGPAPRDGARRNGLRISRSGADRWAVRALPSGGTAGGIGLLALLVILVFFPRALDQFVLPKRLLLLPGVPLLAAMVWVRSGRGSVSPALLKLYGAFLAWSLVLPLANASNPGLHALAGGRLVFMAALLPLAAMATHGEGPAARAILGPITVAGAAVAVLALLQWSGLDPVGALLHVAPVLGGRWRILATTGNPGWTAELVAVVFPLALTLLAAPGPQSRRRWIAAGGATFLAAAAVAVTGSRTGILALGAGTAVWSLARRRGHGGTRLHGARALGLAASVAALTALLALGARTARFGEMPSVTGRLALWDAGIRLTLRHPLAGGGLGHTTILLPEGLREVVRTVPPERWDALPTSLVDRLDDDWLQVAVEAGIPAALLLLAIWASALRLAWRRAPGDPTAPGTAGALAALGVCSLLSAPLHTPATAVLFWILAGIAAGQPGSSPAVRSRVPRILVPMTAGLLVAAGTAVSLHILSLDLAAGRGRTLLHHGRPQAAAELLAPCFRTLPWLTPAGPELAIALERAGRPAEALAVTVEAERWMASERLLAVRTRALAALGHPEAARTVVERGLAVLPRSHVLLETRAWLQQQDAAALPSVPDTATKHRR